MTRRWQTGTTDTLKQTLETKTHRVVLTVNSRQRLMAVASPCLFLALIALCGTGLAGCRPSAPVGQLVGKVVVDGEPLVMGVVALLSAAGEGGSAPLDEAGTFHFVSGLPPGTYRVWLEPPPTALGGPSPEASPQSPEGQVISAQERTERAFRSRVPRAYCSQLTTTLTVTVAEGQNELPIDIKK